MKLIIPFIAFLSLTTSAVEPGPTPKSEGKEKVEAIRQHGGALKIQKNPAPIEGLDQPADEKAQDMQKDKNDHEKKEKTEEKK